MTQPQPNALAAITAALTANQKPAAAAAPAQTAFAFAPQVAPFVQQPATRPAVAPNPFQPSPAQAQAAFVAAVPQAAQQHAHHTTGVPFAPINPPGEATSAPTVGLDAAPVQVAFVATGETVVAPEPAPKGRTRKPRAQSIETAALPAGDGAVQPAAASAARSGEEWANAPALTTEQLVQELAERGWTVTLRK